MAESQPPKALPGNTRRRANRNWFIFLWCGPTPPPSPTPSRHAKPCATPAPFLSRAARAPAVVTALQVDHRNADWRELRKLVKTELLYGVEAFDPTDIGVRGRYLAAQRKLEGFVDERQVGGRASVPIARSPRCRGIG